MGPHSRTSGPLLGVAAGLVAALTLWLWVGATAGPGGRDARQGDPVSEVPASRAGRAAADRGRSAAAEGGPGASGASAAERAGNREDAPRHLAPIRLGATGPGTRRAVEATSAPGADPAAAAPVVDHVLRVLAVGTRRPLSDVTVIAVSGERSARARTGADGRAVVPWPEGLAADLHLRHAHHVDRLRPSRPLGREEELFLDPSATLEVTVLPAPDGPGQVGLWRRRRGGEGWRALAPRAVDSDVGLDAGVGALGIAFTDLEPGEYGLAARWGERRLPFEAGIELGAGERVALLRAPRGTATLVVELIETDGSAAAGVELTLTRRTTGLPRELLDERPSAVTDARGRAQVDGLEPGAWTLGASAPDGRRVAHELDLAPGPRGERVELPPATRRTGRVRDALGAPVADARVQVVGAGGNALGPATHTAADGRFELVDPRPSARLWLAVEPPPDHGAAPARVEVAPRAPARSTAYSTSTAPTVTAGAEVRHWPSVELSAAATLTGRVRGSDGRAQGGVEVELLRPGDGPPTAGARVRTDAEGRFALAGLAPGPIVLLARGRAGERGRLALVLAPGADAADVELGLAQRSTVACRVVDRMGAVLPGVPLEVRVVTEVGEAVRRGPRVSDRVGRVRFERVPAGALEVRVVPGGGELVGTEPPRPLAPHEGELWVTVEPPDHEPPAVVRGSAVASEDGAPLAGLELSGFGLSGFGLSGPGSSDRGVEGHERAGRDAGGARADGPSASGLGGGVLTRAGVHFELRGVRPGRVAPVVSAPGRVPLTLPAFELGPGAEHDLGRLRLERGFDLVVTLVDRDGAPVEGARVALLGASPAAGGRGRDHPERAFTPAEPGVHVLSAVPAATWRLAVRRDGRPVEVRTVRVEATSDDGPWRRTLVLEG